MVDRRTMKKHAKDKINDARISCNSDDDSLRANISLNSYAMFGFLQPYISNRIEYLKTYLTYLTLSSDNLAKALIEALGVELQNIQRDFESTVRVSPDEEESEVIEEDTEEQEENEHEEEENIVDSAMLDDVYNNMLPLVERLRRLKKILDDTADSFLFGES